MKTLRSLASTKLWTSLAKARRATAGLLTRSARLAPRDLRPWLSLLSLSVLQFFSPSVTAQETLTPGATVRWTAAGSAPGAGDGVIVVPVEGQVSRTFTADALAVRVVSRPYFAPSSKAMPSLEIGPAGVTFLRDANGGALVLFGAQPLPLAGSIALGEDNRSAQPLDFTFAYDRSLGRATLQFEGRTFTLDVAGRAGPLDVAVAAGAEQSWMIDTLEVNAIATAAPETDTAKKGPADNRAGKDDPVLDPRGLADARRQARAEAMALFQAGDFTRAEAALLRPSRHQTGTLGWQIEAAGKLTQTALSLRQRYDLAGALKLARRAIEILEEGEKLARSATAREQAIVQEMAAFVHEELLRDPEAARTAYGRAKAAHPPSARASDGLARLDEVRAKSERIQSSIR